MRVKRLIGAAVLAAGAGRRFGGGKLLAPWRGGLLLDGALGAALAATDEPVMVTLGAEGAAVGEAAQAFARGGGLGERLRLIRVDDWAAGLSASLRAVARACPPGLDGVLIFLGDMPRTPRSAPAALIDALDDDILAAAPVTGGELGHPVLITASLLPALAALEGDAGARRLLIDLGPRLARVAIEDPGVLFDVDTPQALAQA